jgi:hypothetical protein
MRFREHCQGWGIQILRALAVRTIRHEHHISFASYAVLRLIAKKGFGNNPASDTPADDTISGDVPPALVASAYLRGSQPGGESGRRFSRWPSPAVRSGAVATSSGVNTMARPPETTNPQRVPRCVAPVLTAAIPWQGPVTPHGSLDADIVIANASDLVFVRPSGYEDRSASLAWPQTFGISISFAIFKQLLSLFRAFAHRWKHSSSRVPRKDDYRALISVG